MKISVVIPVYNVTDVLLRKCLQSVQMQTLRSHEYEVVVIDDCSTDEATIATVAEFVDDTPNAQLVRHGENRGLNEARRTGAAATKGEYVVYVDGDDILTRDAIENLRMEAVKSGADLVTASFFRWDAASRRYVLMPLMARPLASGRVERIKDVVATKHSFTMCGRLFNKAVLTDHVFDLPGRPLHEDLFTFARAIYNIETSCHVQKPLYYYTLNVASITGDFTRRHAESIFEALDDWVEHAKKEGLLSNLSYAMAQGFERLTNTCIERCMSNARATIQEKQELLEYIYSRFEALPFEQVESSLPGIKAIAKIRADAITVSSTQAFEEFKKHFAASAERRVDNEKLFKQGMKPSEAARRFKDKVIFICQVDYQLRAAARFARELRARGHACVILDNSAFASDALRQLPPKEYNIFWRTEHVKIVKPPYGSDWLSTAKLVVIFNDFNDDFREALEYRYRLGLSAVCVIEGINDFLRIDFKETHHLPYRRCDYVFLAGENDRQYFQDRRTYVTGLPIIDALAEKNPVFPERPLAVLNVNFTYGVLEDERDKFITKAKNAFLAAGFDWVITQHPADKASLRGFLVSDLSQYELIDQCSVFVSRFATGILEALASGKPAIYFNPHGEMVDKFKDPLGAFEVATTEEELVTALNQIRKYIEAGVNFRKRASTFLRHHTNLNTEGPSAAECFADAATDVLKREEPRQKAMLDLFFDRLNAAQPFMTEQPGLVFGVFDRDCKAQLNEEEMISRYFGDRQGVMIDVGANFGNSCDVYLGKDWTVHAFEPDPDNRRELLKIWASCDRLIVNEEAVSDKSGQKVPFYASAESTGVSGMSAFTNGHKQIGTVETVTLHDYCRKAGLEHIDFLKVDVEGFDKFVLDGFPWETNKPDVVLAEYDDAKTIPLGYSAHDLAKVMVGQGYVVYVSEWHPVIRYGIAHDWKQLIRYSDELDLSKTWGNMIGLREDPGPARLKELARRTIKFAASGQVLVADDDEDPPLSPKRPLYAPFAEWLRSRSPFLFATLRYLRRTVSSLIRKIS